MASTIYNLVNTWISEKKEVPAFPVACIYDLSNMFSTLQFFASDKILMDMGELNSLVEIMEESITVDWSKCSFPSKFVYKDTTNPLFFMIPIFPRGQSIQMSKDDVVNLSKTLWNISETIGKEGCQYIVYDLPNIDSTRLNRPLVPPLINSNYIIAILDCSEDKYHELENELKTLKSAIETLSPLGSPGLFINAIILNQITEKVRTENWVKRVQEDHGITVIGTIREDPRLVSVSSKYEIAVEEKHIKETRSAPDFIEVAAKLDEIIKDKRSIRFFSSKQFDDLEERVYRSG
jgi:hypothetical protein